MNDFQTMLEDCRLNDLGYVGRWFTWERGRFLATNIRERLDRRVATLNWVNLFPSYESFLLRSLPHFLDTMRMRWNDQCSNVKLFRYFHKITVQRQFRGQISGLEGEKGRRSITTQDMLKLASDSFSNLFSASDMGIDECLFGLVEKRVIDSINDNSLKQFTEEDITYAVKKMVPLKAPGVDGFPAIFFQRKTYFR
ncbi:hypothetical protein J1N35_045221 [Gossypium stocksii]|uniref:Reverse transcriptase domain-containing protein n=1 Tax=Gossypium stocksii TaxID=47602 RepID=A0A9D3UAP1_9ROSI|nr:hypothetical protein J1N35_045221 [Gossypium stocksii]